MNKINFESYLLPIDGSLLLRELLTELAMSRMTEHMRRLEEENREARARITEMETAGSGPRPVPRPR